jgi:hypothetical protein
MARDGGVCITDVEEGYVYPVEFNPSNTRESTVLSRRTGTLDPVRLHDRLPVHLVLVPLVILVHGLCEGAVAVLFNQDADVGVGDLDGEILKVAVPERVDHALL